MMRYRIDSDEVRAELQQFDQWSFGRQLAYARNPQDVKFTRPPGLGRPMKRQSQDGVLDPLQDQRQDPWTKGKTETAPAAVSPFGPQAFEASACDQEDVHRAKEEELQKYWANPKGPQKYDMTPPKDQIIRPRVLGETLTQAVKPTKGRFSRIKKDKKQTFMMSTKGHLEELYWRINEDYDQILDTDDTPEVDSGVESIFTFAGSEGSEWGTERALQMAEQGSWRLEG